MWVSALSRAPKSARKRATYTNHRPLSDAVGIQGPNRIATPKRFFGGHGQSRRLVVRRLAISRGVFIYHRRIRFPLTNPGEERRGVGPPGQSMDGPRRMRSHERKFMLRQLQQRRQVTDIT